MSASRDGDLPGSTAAAALRRVTSPRPLTAAHMERLEAELAARIRQLPAPRRRAWRLAWVVLLMTAAGVAGASIQRFANRRTEPRAVARPAPRRDHAKPPTPSLAVEVAPPPARIATPSSAGTPVSRLTMESRLLGTALRRLRKDAEPAAALALLDEYARRFPRGTLAPEATLARIDALQSLGRSREALAVLDGLDVRALPRARQLLILRGELRAMFGKHAAARSDFDALIETATPADGPLIERALWGRAASLTRLYDAAAARRDLGQYLERFPSGPHAAEARTLLMHVNP